MARLRSERDAAAALVRLRAEELNGVAAAATVEGRDDEHDPDGATPAFDRALAVGLLAQAEQHVVELDEALDRAAAGTYGVCGGCGGPIPTERLEARPAAAFCVPCQARRIAGPG